MPQSGETLRRMQRDVGLLEIITRVAARDDLDQAFHELADCLQSWLGARQVVVGVSVAGSRSCRVKAISGMRTISRQSPVVRSIEAVMDEALLRGELEAKNLSSANRNQATVLQKELAHETNSTTVVCGPLRNGDNDTVGAWVVLDNDPQGSATVLSETMQSAEERLGLCLHVLCRSRRRSVSSRLSRLVAKQRRIRRVVLLAVAAALCGVLAFPMRYTVSCKCTVQPVTRRYIVAPHEGILSEAFVEPGDVVTAGQVVAHMDEREIKWELAGLEAEASRAQKERDTNLAGRDTAAAQLSALEILRLQVKSRQLENRARNLEIKSPVEGVVISGDPKKMQGARLTIGQTLLEVGPLDQMVVEVSVPDEDIAHVKVGQEISMRFEALPTRPHQGEIKKIHPRAVTKDQANVFTAEVRLDNRDGTLRPGMDGRARVHTARHAFGWNLFHKVWQRVAFRMGW